MLARRSTSCFLLSSRRLPKTCQPKPTSQQLSIPLLGWYDHQEATCHLDETRSLVDWMACFTKQRARHRKQSKGATSPTAGTSPTDIATVAWQACRPSDLLGHNEESFAAVQGRQGQCVDERLEKKAEPLPSNTCSWPDAQKCNHQSIRRCSLL